MLYSQNLDEVMPIINSIGASVFLIDVLGDNDFRFFAFNQREEADVRMTTAEASGKRPEDLLDPDYAQHLKNNYQKCVEARTEIEIETFLDTPAGRRYAYNRLSPIFDENGQLVRILGTVIETTAQRRTEQRLKESESKYRALFEQSTEAIVITDPDGIIVDVNPVGLEFLGYEEDELIGQSSAVMYADKSHRETVRQRLLTDGYVREEEFSAIRKDGGIRSGVFNASVLRNDEGEPFHYFGIFRDITEKKSIEDTLYFVAQYHRTSEAFFADLLHFLAQTLGVAYAYLGLLCEDGDSIQTIAVCDHGKPKENFMYDLASSPCETVVGQEVRHYAQHLQQLFPKDELLTQLEADSYIGAPLWKSDGQSLGVIVLMDKQPLHNPKLAETLLQIVAVRAAHELERQLDEQILKEGEARYRAIVEDQTEFIVRWKPDSTRTFVNAAYCRYFQQKSEDLIGTSFFPLIAAEDHDKIRAKIAQITPKTPIQNEIHRVIAPDGSLRWQEWTDRGLVDAAGNLMEVQSVGRDITPRKQAEDALDYTNQLQSLVTVLATEFINIPPQKIDEAIHHAMQAIAEFVGASRCAINLFSDDLITLSRTHEWCADGIEPFIDIYQNLPYKGSGVEWARNYFGVGDYIIGDINDLPEEGKSLRDALERQGARALMAVEMHLREKSIGFISLQFSAPHTLHAEDTIKLLHLVSETFVNALDRKRRDEEIAQLTAELEQRVAERTAALTESEQKFRSISEQAVMGILIVRDGKIIYANNAVTEITKHPLATLLAWEPRHYTNFIHPDDLPKFAAVLQRHTADKEPTILGHTEFRAYTRDRDLIWLEQFSRSIMYEGQPAVLSMIVDITNRKQVEEARKQQRTFMEVLLDTAVALSSTLRSEKLVEHIFQSMQRMVPYDTATILQQVDEEFFDVLARFGYPDERDYGRRHPMKRFKYIRNVLETGQMVIVPDARSDPDFVNHPEHLESMASYLLVPMSLDGKTTGVLTLGSRTAEFFTTRDAQYLQIFAQQAGLALRNAQLYDEAQSLATLQERQRLTRDLHDSVSQTLFSAATLAELAPRLLDDQPEKARGYLIDVQDLTRTALAEMRTLLMELRPDALIRTELGILLRQLCDVLTGNTQLQMTLTITDKILLPEEEQIVFYRVAQEALNNIAKHAQATQVRVELDKSDDQVTLTILDDGRGFSQAEVPPDHFGVRIMHERADSIGAELTINSVQGTEIILSKVGL
jgi:PAS domain S-box-containing protein